jgi:hypothetical protein
MSGVIGGPRVLRTCRGMVPMLAVAAVAVLATASAVAWVWGHQVGGAKARAAAAEAQALAVAAAHEQYQEQVRIGATHGARLTDRLREADSRIASLRKELSDAPRLAVVDVAVPVPIAGPQPPPDPGRSLQLSLGAVRLWNSAASGADLPAGACGIDGQAGPACAVAAGVTVDHALDAAIENTQRLGACVTQLNALIDYLADAGKGARKP